MSTSFTTEENLGHKVKQAFIDDIIELLSNVDTESDVLRIRGKMLEAAREVSRPSDSLFTSIIYAANDLRSAIQREKSGTLKYDDLRTIKAQNISRIFSTAKELQDLISEEPMSRTQTVPR